MSDSLPVFMFVPFSLPVYVCLFSLPVFMYVSFKITCVLSLPEFCDSVALVPRDL